MQETVDQADGANGETSELPPAPPEVEICPNPGCPSCLMVGGTLAGFESAVAKLFVELEKEDRNLQKVDLLLQVALGTGNAFSAIANGMELKKIAVENAKERFVKAAALMNSNYEKIRWLQTLSGIVTPNRMN